MTKPRAPLRFLFDEGVPQPAREPLDEAGHHVILHHEAVSPSASDDLVCIAAIQNDAVLVAIDNDMKRFVKWYGRKVSQDRFKSLHVLRICCGEIQAANRIRQAVSFIEHEWRFTTAIKARRLWVDINSHSLQSHR